MRWTNQQRRLPAPTFKVIVTDVAWSLHLDFNGDGSSIREESKQLPLGGFGSHLYHDYFVLGVQSALNHVMANGLRMDKDLSTVAGVDMLVFRPFSANKPSNHHVGPVEARHVSQDCGQPCFYCGSPPKLNENCQFIVNLMVGPDPAIKLFNLARNLRESSTGRRCRKVALVSAAQSALELARYCAYVGQLVLAELYPDAGATNRRKSAFCEARADALQALANLKNHPEARKQTPWLFSLQDDPGQAALLEKKQAAALRSAAQIPEPSRSRPRSILGRLLGTARKT